MALSSLNITDIRLSKRIAIIGGGIVGLSLGMKLGQKFKNSRVTIFEKESKIGLHQSGRNSGVLHCGLGYRTGTLKARLAVDGINQMVNFCQKNNVAYDICGKVVVANSDSEIKNIINLAAQGKSNGLDGIKFLNNTELSKREPNVRAKKSLLVPGEGIVDFKGVMSVLASFIKENNGEILTSSTVKKVEEVNNSNIVHYEDGPKEFDLVFNCSGLHSDRIYYKSTGKKSHLKIIPFRGDYLKFKDKYKEILNHLVYPVPDSKYPFLGVHFTRMINGDREVGPNAVLAFKREGYSFKDFSLDDMLETLFYKGFYKFISKNLFFSLRELGTSLSDIIFINQARKLIPDINSSMFDKGISGVRAQTITNTGELFLDFGIYRNKNQVHILNAPSPGATASLAIADYVIKNYCD